MEANNMNPDQWKQTLWTLIRQSDLGPCCLQYRLPKKVGRWEERTPKVVTGRKRVKQMPDIQSNQKLSPIACYAINVFFPCNQKLSLIARYSPNVFSRGKGDNYRLGHGTEEHVRLPKQIERFNGKKVKDISVGSMHCLAVTEEGEVYGWGRNEQGQLGDMTIQSRPEPAVLPGLDGKNIVGAACGPSQVLLYMYLYPFTAETGFNFFWLFSY